MILPSDVELEVMQIIGLYELKLEPILQAMGTDKSVVLRTISRIMDKECIEYVTRNRCRFYRLTARGSKILSLLDRL